MSRSLDPPLVPKNGKLLRALGIARISTEHQDGLSNDDQLALYRRLIEENCDYPYEMTPLASRGSGECVERAEIETATSMIESGNIDLVICEDLGRIFRRVHAHLFCELCEDYRTRLIAINDHVDTFRDDWRLHSFFAVFRHESYNQDTANRIRRSLRNRFSQGGVFQYEIFGLVKPVGAKNDSDVHKDPSAEPIYDEWFRKLENGATYEEVADWLNEIGIPTGKYCRTRRWNGKMVARITFNTLLKGWRQRNRKMSRRINSTGRRTSVNAPPSELLERHCPHLAFIDPARYDHVIRLLRERNRKYRRERANGTDCRRNVSRKRTKWPGQSVQCGVRGRPYVYGGHGLAEHLMCIGAKNYECWNAITFNGAMACRILSSAVFDTIASLPEFESDLLRRLDVESNQLDLENLQRIQLIRAEQSRLEREKRNLLDAIRQVGGSQSIFDELKSIEMREGEIHSQMRVFEKALPKKLVLPSMEALRQLAAVAFTELAHDSQEFARCMRKIACPIHVFPYRLCDGGHIVLRAQIQITAAALLDSASASLPSVVEHLSRVVTVDLFNAPQRVAFCGEVMRLTNSTDESLTEREIAKRLGITQPAVQNAKRLYREMASRGLVDPFVPVKEPPADYPKLRRHRHKRFRFEPLTGFPRDWPS